MSDPRHQFLRRFLICMIACVLAMPVAFAQVTTGNISGVVTDPDGSALPGVTVEAVHTPTGTRYSDVTDTNGRYAFQNVRVGGPYRITANLEGFRPVENANTQVALGVTAEVPLKMSLAAVTEAITVTARADDVINPNRTGSSSSVSNESIESLPSVNRSLQDFARTNPYFRVDASDNSSTRVNVAGRNNRYNQIQIDGAVNNDLFGLADTGTPGGQTDAQPISLDAIEQLQLVVSPYDVRQSGFTGGGINAVTRSGTNEFRGSIFGTKRNQDYVGEGPFGTKLANFDQTQYGGRIGGPILRDKLFFFFSGELNRREEPTGLSADSSTDRVYSGTGTGSVPSAQLVKEFVQQRYGYDAGSLGDFPGETNNDLIFGRLDWNAAANHQMTLRHNYVDAVRDIIADRGTSPPRFRFDNSIYTQADETNSTVAQLNSVFGASSFNEARVTYQTIRDKRATPVIFPTVEIGGTGPRSGAVHIGTERFSGANTLDQDVIEINNDFTWVKNNHTLVFGTHNEFFEFKNLFISEAYGYYYYPTLDAFMNNQAQEYRVGFATGADARRPTAFEVRQYGFYVNDTWRIRDNVTLTGGLRADLPEYIETPTFNATVMSAIGRSTADAPSQDFVWSPRLGFNWNPGGSGNQQLRGGIGVFAGRTPYVWVSNAYGNTGVEQVLLGCTGTCVRPAFNPDPLAQPRNLGAGGTPSVDLVDSHFTFPQVLRSTLGYDRNLFWGIRGSAEVVYSQTQEDVFYYNLNKLPTGQTSPLDGRPTFRNASTQLFDAVLLTNTSEGHETTATLQLSRPFANGLTVGGSFAWQDAQSAFDATSSRAISNWQFRHTAGDIYAHDLSNSAFEVENRFTVYSSYAFRTGPLSHTVGLFYNAQSGRPYSLMMAGDPNTDGYTTNDLLYVPNRSIILCPSTAGNPTVTSPCGTASGAAIAPIDAARFTEFLNAAGVDTNTGEILDRYSLNEPWSRQLDFHYELGLPIRGFETQLQFDITNLLNMFDENAGVVSSVANQNYTPVRYRGLTADGTPIYSENAPNALNPGAQFSTAFLRSRWQARLGLRINFDF
jgi:outer membrane receptor for ferrienterochelin and colicin